MALNVYQALVPSQARPPVRFCCSSWLKPCTHPFPASHPTRAVPFHTTLKRLSYTHDTSSLLLLISIRFPLLFLLILVALIVAVPIQATCDWLLATRAAGLAVVIARGPNGTRRKWYCEAVIPLRCPPCSPSLPAGLNKTLSRASRTTYHVFYLYIVFAADIIWPLHSFTSSIVLLFTRRVI
jgi:hypothetical protein